MSGIELGAAYISILPSTDKIAPGIKSALDGSVDDVRRAGDKAGSEFGTGFKATLGGFLKTGLFAGAAGAGLLGGLGVKTAAELEQADIAFTTMLGSAEKAKAFIADLTEFAAKTPFEFPGLQSAASSLISAGIATRDVLPIMETLGDVTSGMGTGAEGIQRATVALQQMNAAGKVTGEDLNQLRDAGIPVFDLLSASMGKTKAEIAEMAQAGTLGAEGLNAIMDGLKSGKGLERFSGLMEKQSASLTGMWSTFKDTLGMGMAEAVKPLIPLLKDGLGGAAKALPPIIGGVADALKGTIEVTSSLVGWFKEHKTTTTVLATAVGALATGVLTYNAYMKITAALTTAWGVAQKALNAAMALNPVGLIIAAIVALGVALFVAWRKSETFRSIVLGAFDMVKTAAGAVARFFTEKIPAAFGAVIGWVRQNWPKILAVLTGPIGLAVLVIARNWDRIKAGAGATKDWIVGRFTALVGFVRGLPGKIRSAAAGMWDGIKDSFRGAINWIVTKWNSLDLSIPAFDPPGPGPKFPGTGDLIPDIPMLAKGGILTEPTLNIAGEAGTEVVTPLDRLEGWINRAAEIGAGNEASDGSAIAGAATPLDGAKLRLVVGGREFDAYVEDMARPVAENVFHGEREFAGAMTRMH